MTAIVAAVAALSSKNNLISESTYMGCVIFDIIAVISICLAVAHPC